MSLAERRVLSGWLISVFLSIDAISFGFEFRDSVERDVSFDILSTYVLGSLSVTFLYLPLPWSFIHFGFCHESQHKAFLSLEVVTVVASLFRPHLCCTVAIKSRVICF